MKYHRRSIRLNNYDYSNNGYYFVTVCANWKGNVFGKIDIVGARRDAPIINNKNNLSIINKNDNHLCDIEINKNVEIKLNRNGKIIENVWKTLPNHHNVILDEFIVMPDHIHFILVIKNGINVIKNIDNQINNKNDVIDNNHDWFGNNKMNMLKNNIQKGVLDYMVKGALDCKIKGASRRAPTYLGFVIGIFKTECTKQINKLNKTPGIQIFQRNYFERIIRNEKEYFAYKKYIRDNPMNFE